MNSKRKSGRPVWRDIVELAMSAMVFWLALHPGQIREIEDRARMLWTRITHKVDVWQAVQEIRTLPEL